MFLLLAALFKVQYLYIILVFPLSLLLILPSFIYEKKTTIIFGKLFHVFVIIAGFAVLMWLIWYLPNKERFHFYYEKQQFFRLDRSWKDMSDTRHFWSRVLFYDGDWSVYRLPYKITLAIAFVILLLPKKFSFKPEIAFTLAWTIFEWHKFNFSYLPERYLLGIFVSGILLMLLVSFSLFQKLKFYAVPFIAVLFFLPLKWKIKTAVENFQNRKFTLINSQQKMKNYIHKNEVVLGAYASSLCWNTGCETHYINDTASNGKNIFTCFTPDYVICDSAEYDIGKAFSAQHVNIHDFATPLDTFRFSFLSAILYKVDKEKWNNMAVMKSN